MSYGCPEYFRESLTTPTATFPKIFKGILFRFGLWMCVQNLKFVALPVPEIIWGYSKNLGRPWIRPRAIPSIYTLALPLSSSSSFNFEAHEQSKWIQIKAGTTRQETALTVALKININTSIKHQTQLTKHTMYEKTTKSKNSKNKVGRS